MEDLRGLVREMRDAAFLVSRDGRVLFENGRLPPGVEPSEAERFNDRMPEPLHLPEPLPEKEAVTDRVAYASGRNQWHTVRRRLVPDKAGVICILAAEEASESATRLEVLGRMVGYVAHDLNNVLTAVSGHTDLLRDTIAEDRPERISIDQIREAGRYAARLTHRLLAFGYVAPARPRELELNEQVGEFCKALARLLSPDVTVEFHAAAQPTAAWFDAARLDQVLLVLAFGLHDNLLQRGTIRVRIDARPAVIIEAAPLRNEALEPSFGALACVRGLIDGTDASLQVRGPGWYALELPRVGTPPSARGEGTVLVVDRPDESRVACVKTLESAGYRVLVAGTAEQAVAVAREDGAVQVLLTAFGRAGINGPLLVQHFAREFPEVSSLLLSGLSAGGDPDSTSRFVPSHYTAEELLSAVARALQ